MLDEVFLRDIPDVLESDDSDLLLLHAKLYGAVSNLQRRKQQALDKYQVIIPIDEYMVNVRLNLLIQHGLGIDTMQRFQYELDWIKIYAESLEKGLNEAAMQKRDLKLHLPDGRTRRVRSEEDGNGK